MSGQQSELIIDDNKFALKGTRGEKGAPMLRWGVFNGQPSASMFTNDPNDTERRPIRAAFGIDGWSFFITTLKDFIESGKTESVRVELRTGPPTKTFAQSTMVIGVEPNGRYFLSIISKGRPAKKVFIEPSVYFTLQDKEGNPMDDKETFRLWALGYVDILNKHIVHYMQQTYIKPQPMGGGGGQRGGQQRGGYGGGGQQQRQPAPAADSGFDDDIPF